MTAPLRTAITLFTALPVPTSSHEDVTPSRARAAVAWLPIVGAGLGALAALPAVAIVSGDRYQLFLSAVISVVVLTLLTRGLHLDGLADAADGLGSRAPAERALEIMRRSDIGPFGVLAIVLVVLLDISALTELPFHSDWTMCAALATAAATGRLAVVHACLPGTTAARPDGFGALVAGGIRPGTAVLETAAVLGLGSALAVSVDADALAWPVAQAAALAIAWLVRVHATRRFGGITGDVFGALVEITTALTLVGLALS